MCGTVLGWKYVEAKEEAQRYKVGKFILETRRVVKCGGWEGGRGCGNGFVGEEGCTGEEGEDEVEFDSQDEEECEDLFSGVWSEGVVRRRRKGKGF